MRVDAYRRFLQSCGPVDVDICATLAGDPRSPLRGARAAWRLHFRTRARRCIVVVRPMEKKMTAEHLDPIERLTALIERRFDQVDGRLDRIDTRLDQMDAR